MYFSRLTRNNVQRPFVLYEIDPRKTRELSNDNGNTVIFNSAAAIGHSSPYQTTNVAAIF